MADEERESESVSSASQVPPEIVDGKAADVKDDVQEKGVEEVTDGETPPPTTAETLGISYRRLVIIMIGLCLTIFLTALDQTIVSTAVPTIAADFHDASGYTWIGTSYLLASTVPLPLYGKISDIWGRKPALFISIGFFELGSALCGASQNMQMLLASRAIQGIGGGGIMGLSNIIISDITSLRDRAYWTSLIGATWAIAAASGPLIGGAIASSTTWRWCFLINLPIGAVCSAIIFFYLHMDSPKMSFWDKAPRVDYLGTILIGGSAVMFLLALNWAGAGYSWGSTRVIGLLVGSAATLIPFYFVEKYWAKEPVMPLRLFTCRTNVAAYWVGMCHRIVYMGLTYYLPLYFQAVKGYSAIKSGVALLPYILTCCFLSAIVGKIVTHFGRYNEVIRGGFAISVLGGGFLTLFNVTTPAYEWILIEIVLGLGVGGNFQNMLIALQATIHHSDIAVATATFVFIVLLGSTLGIAIGGAVFQNQMTALAGDLPNIPGIGALDGATAGAAVPVIQSLPSDVKAIVVSNVAESMRTVWIVLLVFAAVGFLSAFAIGTHELYSEYALCDAGLEANCSIRTDQPAMMNRKKEASSEKAKQSESLSDASVAEKV